MVSKYFNYVLVLAFLVGVTAPLPQVKDQVAQTFSLANNTALAFGSVTSMPLQMMDGKDMMRPPVQGGEQGQPIRQDGVKPMQKMLTPEQVINILAKAGIIPAGRVDESIKIIRTQSGIVGQPGPRPGDDHGNGSSTMPRVVASNWVMSKGNVSTPTNGVWIAAYPTISFTITNLGNDPIYLSKTATNALSLSTSNGSASQVSIVSFTANGSSTGDTTSSFIVNGSRTFTANLTVDNTGGTTASKKIKITQINFGTAGTSGSDNTLSITDRLENAYVQVP